MIRILLCLPLFLCILAEGCSATILAKADKDILRKFWKYAETHRLADGNIGERIPLIAEFFIGTPYKSNTLNVTREELPVINLHELDCVTFVENVLALAFLKQYDATATEQFVENIVRLRYRNGEIIDYTSRLHYSSDWLYEMQRQHLLTDITSFAGGIAYNKQVYYMSKNYTAYPPLKNDSTLLEKIKEIETAINRRTYYFIPKDRLSEACSRIKNGDVLLITTNIEGLDTSHLGFAYKKNGHTYLLHASSKGKKVMISEIPLQEYMEEIGSQTGIMVGRAVKQPNL